MEFENPLGPDIKIQTIFEYNIDDFSKEEIELIKRYWENYIENFRYSQINSNLLTISQPRRIEINDELKNGLEELEKKDLAINNTLRLRSYIYYEKFIDNKLNNIMLLCRLLNYIEEYHKTHIGDPFGNDFFERIPIGPRDKAHFLLLLLKDLDLIYFYTDLLTGNLISLDLTSNGRYITSGFCPFWDFKTLIKLANDTKERFLFESYNNIRVRITVYNIEGIKTYPDWLPSNEILYFRIDFTDEDPEQKKPIFSIHNRTGLFEEILSLSDLETRIEISPFLKYNFNNYVLEFVYPVPSYFYYNNFKEKIKGNYDYSRVSCKDLINFIFFDHLDQIHRMEFSHRNLENIEFRSNNGSLLNVREKVNNFMGINLNAIDLPNLVIVFPIKSFKILEPIFKEINGKKFVELRWNVEKEYLPSFRCKTKINGIYYDIPPEGLKKEIEDLNQGEFIIKIQWCGDSEFFPLDTELASVAYKNQYYQPSTTDDKEIKRRFFTFLKRKDLFIQEIGGETYSNLKEEVAKLKEKCGQRIKAEDCERCERSTSKICLTKLFSYSLGKEVLPHCGHELADCYWISENEGNAIVLKATDMNRKRQYMDALSQIIDLSQNYAVKIIFFGNNKRTSRKFISNALHLCKTNKKQFIEFNQDNLIQILYFFKKSI